MAFSLVSVISTCHFATIQVRIKQIKTLSLTDAINYHSEPTDTVPWPH